MLKPVKILENTPSPIYCFTPFSFSISIPFFSRLNIPLFPLNFEFIRAVSFSLNHRHFILSFSSIAFEAWAKGLGINMPIVDFRQTMFDPLGYPIFLQPFKEDYILDIIQGKKVVKMTIDINAWMRTFENNSLTV